MKCLSCLVHAVIPLLYLTMYVLAFNNNLYQKKEQKCVYEAGEPDGSTEPKVSGTTEEVDGGDIFATLLFQGEKIDVTKQF